MLAEASHAPRELVQRGAGGARHRLVAGTPEQITDDLQAWYEAGAADGFTVMDLPNSAQFVVPILQKRGLFPDDWTHPTYRGRLGL
ncbi:MAG TPA: hypothetical protein VN408_25765 [Actinoplanes sp.]|nr:hypothetical protein [Actinoplanes sp.]